MSWGTFVGLWLYGTFCACIGIGIFSLLEAC